MKGDKVLLVTVIVVVISVFLLYLVLRRSHCRKDRREKEESEGIVDARSNELRRHSNKEESRRKSTRAESSCDQSRKETRQVRKLSVESSHDGDEDDRIANAEQTEKAKPEEIRLDDSNYHLVPEGRPAPRRPRNKGKHGFDSGLNSDGGPTIRPTFKISTDAHFRPRYSVTTPIGYTPQQIRTAYGMNNISANGAGQTIGIIVAYNNPNALKDFKTFDTTFNLGYPNNLTVYSFGRKNDQGWALESSMDVQWAHAMAPAAKILLVQARSAGFNDLSAAISYAVKQGASVISMSWGADEFKGENTYDSMFSPGLKNISFLASSGDTAGVSSWPAAAPNVLAIGGTTLKLDAQGAYGSETGWNGSGGGISPYEAIPSWQSAAGLTQGRQTPDIGLNADPNTGAAVYDSYGYAGQTGWFRLGGTSLSCPLMAGVIAVANQIRTSAGKPNLTNQKIANYLYGNILNTSNYLVAVNDVSSGNSGANVCKSGYDLVTGLGTPKNTSDTAGLIAQLVQA